MRIECMRLFVTIRYNCSNINPKMLGGNLGEIINQVSYLRLKIWLPPIFYQQHVEKVSFAGFSKMYRCKAPEFAESRSKTEPILSREAYFLRR